jgi:dolichyl-phosphate-mannose--protein O-mannosyl transferase
LFFISLVHPPLGKLTFALIGWMFGHDGNFPLKHIGEKFNFPQFYHMVSMIVQTKKAISFFSLIGSLILFLFISLHWPHPLAAQLLCS